MIQQGSKILKMTDLEKRNPQVNTSIIIIIIVVMKITWTGCCSDLTASAAEIEPTLDRWTARSGAGPADDDEDEDGNDGDEKEDDCVGDDKQDAMQVDEVNTETKVVTEGRISLNIVVKRTVEKP